jgi:hypothetical protein
LATASFLKKPVQCSNDSDAQEAIGSRDFHGSPLSAHDQIDARKDGLHLPLWDFADSLGQLPFIDGHDL